MVELVWLILRHNHRMCVFPIHLQWRFCEHCTTGGMSEEWFEAASAIAATLYYTVGGMSEEWFEAASAIAATLYYTVGGMSEEWFEAASVVAATLYTVRGMSEEWFGAASVAAATLYTVLHTRSFFSTTSNQRVHTSFSLASSVSKFEAITCCKANWLIFIWFCLLLKFRNKFLIEIWWKENTVLTILGQLFLVG